MLRAFTERDAMRVEESGKLVVAGYISTDTKPSFRVVAVTWEGSGVQCVTCCFRVEENSASCRVLLGFDRTFLTSKTIHDKVLR